MAGPANFLLQQIAQGAQPRMADAAARGAQQGANMLVNMQQQQDRNALAKIAQARATGGLDAGIQTAGQLGQYEPLNQMDTMKYGRGRDVVGDQRDARNFGFQQQRAQVGDQFRNREFNANQSYRDKSLALQSRPNYSIVNGPDGNAYAIDPRNPQGGYMPIPGQPQDPFMNALGGGAGQPQQPAMAQPQAQGAPAAETPRTLGNVPPEVRQQAQQLIQMGDRAGARELVKDWVTGGRGDPKLETDMRNEINKLTTDYRDVEGAYGRVRAAVSNPSPAGDLSLIFNYMKMLDPGSTVREGEFATAQNAAGIPTQVVNMYNRAMSGERLAPAQRNDFASQAQNLYAAAQQRYEYTANQYKGIANRQGLRTENIFVPLDPTYAQPPVADNSQPEGVGDYEDPIFQRYGR